MSHCRRENLRFQYTGQAWLPELGMYHYKARVYSPTLGRFLQTDPVGYEDQMNLYAYVANDPVSGRDPTGTQIAGTFDLDRACNGNAGCVQGARETAGEIGLITGAAVVDVLNSPVSPGPDATIVVTAMRGAERAGFFSRLWSGVKGLFRREVKAPEIKPGSAGGETAGKVFPQAVKDAAKAENPSATCVYCRRPGTGTQVDHSIPRARGGDATLDNAQFACPHCNASKGAGDFPRSPPPGYRGKWPPDHW